MIVRWGCIELPSERIRGTIMLGQCCLQLATALLALRHTQLANH